MTKSKKLEKVVVEEETTPTAGVVTEVTEAGTVVEVAPVEQSVEQSKEGVTELNAAEAAEANGAEGQGEQEGQAEGQGEQAGETSAETETETSEETSVTNGKGIPSQVITDPFGRKSSIYQPQVASKAKPTTPGVATGVNARKGEILKRNEI